ncbi:MAG: sigma-54 dependent transcriptional regulator, partial [Candidatus Acidiferrum sp.]
MANLIGRAPTFLRAIEQIPAIARSEAPVLITGETGTGKELVARGLHYQSDRDRCAFVSLNCGSFCDSLLEDELFGHERGAFTSATARREGLIAHAEGGTLFLDEIDSLPPKAQVDLLQVLQNKRYRPVGSNIEREANVRILAASNAPIAQLVRTGLFRADLFHRLCVFQIELPPLRQRKADIPLLAAHFLEKHSPKNQPVPSFSQEAHAALVSRDWPGNIRELENVILRAIHLKSTDQIEIRDLGLHCHSLDPQLPLAVESGEIKPFKEMKKEMIAHFERAYLVRLMSDHGGNVSRAAQTAQKERRDLGKLLKKYQIDPKSFCGSTIRGSLHPPPRHFSNRQTRLPVFKNGAS